MEETMGTTLNSILRDRLFYPLGLKHVAIAQTPADLAGVEMCSAGGYHPLWVYHGLLAGPLREAALLLDRLLQGLGLPPKLMEQMLTGHRVGAHIPERPWQKPAYGLGLMCGTIAQDASSLAIAERDQEASLQSTGSIIASPSEPVQPLGRGMILVPWRVLVFNMSWDEIGALRGMLASADLLWGLHMV
jgi:CubicO group peptidase (beta-lactamase class C family)